MDQKKTGLPDNSRSVLESLSADIDKVREHIISDHPAQLEALVSAQGTHIQVAPGQEKHLQHEASGIVCNGFVAGDFEKQNEI